MTVRYSTITCPLCRHRKTETMPTDACQYFYDCEGCQATLKPKAGDCCVFCSYGDVPCPPVQAARLTGGQADCCAQKPLEHADQLEDWVANARSYAMAWGLPTALILIGLLTGPTARAALWTLTLAWMGGACLLNAALRTHALHRSLLSGDDSARASPRIGCNFSRILWMVDIGRLYPGRQQDHLVGE
jgi:hypothetical protein